MNITKKYILYLLTELALTAGVMFWAWGRKDWVTMIVSGIVGVSFLISTCLLWAIAREIKNEVFPEDYKTLQKMCPSPLDTLHHVRGFARGPNKGFRFPGGFTVVIYEQHIIISYHGQARWIPYDEGKIWVDGKEGFDQVLVIEISREVHRNERGQTRREELEEQAVVLDAQIDQHIEELLDAQAAGSKIKKHVADKNIDKSMEQWLDTKVQAQEAAQTEGKNVYGLVLPAEKLQLIMRLAGKQTGHQ